MGNTPIDIGDLHFDSKADALSYFRDILQKTRPGDLLMGKDRRDVESLIRNHPRAKEKIGIGIKFIKVINSLYGAKCFQFIREDNTTDTVSYTKCINCGVSNFLKFNEACRLSITPFMVQIKKNYFTKDGLIKEPAICQLTGEVMFFSDAQVDHRQPMTFSQIIDRFIELKSIDVDKIEYETQGTFGHVFKDKCLEKEFIDYHNKKAVLNVIKKSANQAKAGDAIIKRKPTDLIVNSQ